MRIEDLGVDTSVLFSDSVALNPHVLIILGSVGKVIDGDLCPVCGILREKRTPRQTKGAFKN